MSGDYSRWSFDPQRDFSALLKQQGRVDTDADWNEAVALLLRRLQAGTLDTVGPAVVPRTTPNAFHIEAAGGTFTIDRGRMYVDGLLAENHGGGQFAWDARLAEQDGTAPVPYANQPYFPNPPALPAGGPHLVYLKVWLREVTHIEGRRYNAAGEPVSDLVEKALGVDTATRLQTVWQARALANPGAGVDCSTALEDIAAFRAAEPPAGGRLSTDTADVPGEPDPCHVPPSGGYKGLENQLYRVEIHRGGDLAGANRATFKWSRDNASVASRVTTIPSLDRIVVESVGRDGLLRFSDGDWIEITDDWRELNDQPGELRRIRAGGGVDDATRTLLLETPLVAGQFPVDAQGRVTPARNTRVRRWDQRGRVVAANGTLVVDLDQPGATGAIPVQNGPLLLEHGIVVDFDLVAGGVFRSGDHWLFSARANDATVQRLDRAPPLGIHAHYAKLALVTFPDDETDCRVQWPPESGERGCDCSVCVTPESHATGTLTIQSAIDRITPTGGTVCLGAGSYALRAPLRIDDARALRLRGQSSATVLLGAQGGPLLQVSGCTDVFVENLALLTSSAETGQSAVMLRGSVAVTVQGCLIANFPAGDLGGAAIALAGSLLGTTITRCLLYAQTGIDGTPAEGLLATLGLIIEGNTLACRARGIALGMNAVHIGETRIAGNTIAGCSQLGVQLLGANLPDGAANLAANLIVVEGDGIVCGADAARIGDNDIRAAAKARTGSDGIVLARGLDPGGIDHCQILANRIRGMVGTGISIRAPVVSAMIKHNVIAECGAGITVEEDGDVEALVVENNQLLDIAHSENTEGSHLAAIQLSAVRNLELAGNTIVGFARSARQSASRAAIRIAAVESARVAGNRLTGIAPPAGFLGVSVGIEMLLILRSANVADNAVRRSGAPGDKLAPGRWIALVIGSSSDKGDQGGFDALGTLGVARMAGRAWVFSGRRMVEVPAFKPGDAGVSGNALDAEESDDAPLWVQVVRGCTLSGNRIHASGARLRPAQVLADRAIVSNNDWRGRGESPVLDLRLRGKGQPAVLGNVSSGPILVNGAALPAPWAALNPITTE
jgi:hypothetical protein